MSTRTTSADNDDQDGRNELPAHLRTHLQECHECGLFQEVEPGHVGSAAQCGRCGAVLRRFRRDSLGRPFALAIAGMILLAIAVLTPFMSFTIEGRTETAYLLTGVFSFYDLGFYELFLFVGLTIAMAPALKLTALLYVLIGMRMKRPWPYLPAVFSAVMTLAPWAMIEVFLLGLFIAYTKLIDLATIEVGPGVFALAGLMVVMVAQMATLDPHDVWDALEEHGVLPRMRGEHHGHLIGCDRCEFVTSEEKSPDWACPRCHAPLRRRRPNDLTNATAFALAGAIFYIPANIFPVMTIISFGKPLTSTILGGVEELLGGGMWPLALIVFFASISVPCLKLIGMFFLIFLSWRRSSWRLRERTQLYRIIEGIGRWSMIDIFAITILVALVKLGTLATIVPDLGATCFAAVVVLTMFAAGAFDPRVAWDRAGFNRHVADPVGADRARGGPDGALAPATGVQRGA